MMARPIAVASGQAFAFPNVCYTPTSSGATPVPYTSVADLSAADGVSENVTVGGKGVILAETSIVRSTSGDEAGTGGGVVSGTNGDKCEFPQGSGSVQINGKKVVRMGDATRQNNGNADGVVMSGDTTVLVGG